MESLAVIWQRKKLQQFLHFYTQTDHQRKGCTSCRTDGTKPREGKWLWPKWWGYKAQHPLENHHILSLTDCTSGIAEGKAAEAQILKTTAFSSLGVFQGMMPGGIENRFAGSVFFEHLSSWLQYLRWREREKREREIRWRQRAKEWKGIRRRRRQKKRLREREVNELERAGGKYGERGGGVYEVIEKWGGQREERSVIKQGSEWKWRRGRWSG